MAQRNADKPNLAEAMYPQLTRPWNPQLTLHKPPRERTPESIKLSADLRALNRRIDERLARERGR